MAIERPVGSGKKEKVSLDSAAKHILEECRMVLPGIQALFGFQLIAVFNERFDGKLSGPQQDLHFAAIALVTLAVAIVMAPAAIHRQTAQREVSERFIWLASRLLVAGMVPLALAIGLDLYLVGILIVDNALVAGVIAAAALAGFALLWGWLPRRERRLRNE